MSRKIENPDGPALIITSTGEKLSVAAVPTWESATSITCEKYVTEEQAQEQNKKLEDKLKRMQKKAAERNKKYEERIAQLEAKQYHYKVGQELLWKNKFVVKITHLIDFNEYKYMGDIINPVSHNTIAHALRIRQEDLTADYLTSRYIDSLILSEINRAQHTGEYISQIYVE